MAADNSNIKHLVNRGGADWGVGSIGNSAETTGKQPKEKAREIKEQSTLAHRRMCIIAKKAHLSNTEIFTCVCDIKEGPARQLVVYKNKVTFTPEGGSENIMCLPIPLKEGLVPEEHIILYDFSSKKRGALEQAYKDFFSNVATGFNVPVLSLSKSRSRSSSSKTDSDLLEVVKVGNYMCSIARAPADVLRLDPAVFGTPVGLQQVLQNNYANNFAFLICRFSQNGKDKELDLHPIAYTHPIPESGTLFIPTRHYHGGEEVNDEFVDDWDHAIYVLGADPGYFNETLANAKVKKGTQRITTPQQNFNKQAQAVLEHALKKHNVDSFQVDRLFTKQTACKINIKGSFSNLDFQPHAVISK